MHKNAFLLLKNSKNRPALAPRHPASGGFTPRPQWPPATGDSAPSQTPIENSWLRHWTMPTGTGGKGIESGQTFCRQGEKDQFFVILGRTSFMDGPFFTFLVAV